MSLMVKKLHNDKSVRFLSGAWKGKAVHSTHCSVHPVTRIRLATFDWTLKAKPGSGSLCQHSGAFQNTVQLIVLFMVILFCRKNPWTDQFIKSASSSPAELVSSFEHDCYCMILEICSPGTLLQHKNHHLAHPNANQELHRPSSWGYNTFLKQRQHSKKYKCYYH